MRTSWLSDTKQSLVQSIRDKAKQSKINPSQCRAQITPEGHHHPGREGTQRPRAALREHSPLPASPAPLTSGPELSSCGDCWGCPSMSLPPRSIPCCSRTQQRSGQTVTSQILLFTAGSRCQSLTQFSALGPRLVRIDLAAHTGPGV